MARGFRAIMVEKNNSTIQLIVFDLDDTLLDTTSELLPIANTSAFLERLRRPLPLIPGAIQNLEYLVDRYQLALLTQGDPQIQKSKIKSLSISSFFKATYIANKSSGETKAQYFQKLPQEFNLQPQNILSIGNRLSTDLIPAKQLGFRTCHFHYGEHLDEVTKYPPQLIDFRVHSHQELISVCSL